MGDIHRALAEDDTVPILSSRRGQVALARYRLRTITHHITADCERLYGELDRPARQAWREAAGRALLACRQIWSIVEHQSNRQGQASDAPDALNTLRADIVEPQRAIVDAMSSLLTLIPTDLEEELMMDDARAIRQAAVGLLASAPHTTTGSGSGVQEDDRGGDGVAAKRPPRVLVVDDEEVLRRNLSRLLGHLGYDVVTAPDGRAALEAAERELPDLIITDLTMPEMDGNELLVRLKGTSQTQHIPVIVVTGTEDIESIVRCLEHGAEDYLSKPFEAVILQARVRASLGRKHMRDQELAYLRRVAQLTAAAEAVESQTYESRLLKGLMTTSDPLGQLARVFDRMVTDFRVREEQLESQLRQLRREIEQVEASGTVPPVPAVSEESPLAVGQTLADRYEIKRELGKGGMGMVYQAWDRELAEDVAIKVVRQDLIGQDPNLAERLKSEIRLARRISHRNVVRAFDLGEWQGVYYLTMEYIKGVTVADLIATHGRLTIPSTLAIGTQLADALVVAHTAGIIHRDIKPQNLLVDEAGILKVMDFGLARPVQRSAGLTQGGYVVGTPRYMAPEQLLGGEVDARTDLFSAGVVLYECLAGRVPFEASSPMASVAQMLEAPPPPICALVPTVPPALGAAVDRLLQREPERRTQSARDLAEQLAQVRQLFA